MEEELPILKQAFSLCLWLQMNTKLETTIFLDGKIDVVEILVKHGEDTLVDFMLESFSKKSNERVILELNRLIAQLLVLKNTEHYKQI